MTKTTLMLATLLVAPACDREPSSEQNASGKPEGAKASAEEPNAEAEPSKADAQADAWKSTLASRVLADSGLGVGGRLSAFQIVNAESGEEYCQVCRFGSAPKLMVVGSADDEAFKKDLKDLDAIAHKYEPTLKTFAVISEIEQGKAITPSDLDAAQERAKALKEELGISIPVVVPAQEDGKANRVWDEYYNITKSRTVMFSDGRNEVKYSGVGPADWSALDEAIRGVVGDAAPPPPKAG
jgi:hypothetical protein